MKVYMQVYMCAPKQVIPLPTAKPGCTKATYTFCGQGYRASLHAHRPSFSLKGSSLLSSDSVVLLKGAPVARISLHGALQP